MEDPESILFDVLLEKHEVTIPKHIRNILISMGLHKPFVLEEANEQFNNNRGSKMEFDFEEIENFVKNDNDYLALANEKKTDYFGPMCGDPKNFKLKYGEKLMIKSILRIIKNAKNKKNHWKLDPTSNNEKENSEDKIVFKYDRIEEEKELRERLEKVEYPQEIKLDIKQVSIKILVEGKEYKASMRCPLCSVEVSIKKYLNKTGTKMLWNVSNFDRHVFGKHCLEDRKTKRLGKRKLKDSSSKNRSATVRSANPDPEQETDKV